MKGLPVIEMPKKPEPEPVKETVKKKSVPLPETDNLPIIDQVMSPEPQQEEMVVEDVEDQEEDVFSSAAAPRMAAVQPELAPTPAPPQEFDDKPKGKRKYTRKAPMSEKQIEHLARIREIAAEKRRVTKELKEKEKEELAMKKAEKKLLDDEMREQRAQAAQAAAARKAEQETKAPTPQFTKSSPTPLASPANGFSKEDLDNAVLSAITSYDSLRKKQKAEKKEQQLVDNRQNLMKRQIQNAIQPAPVNAAPHDPWRSLFS